MYVYDQGMDPGVKTPEDCPTSELCQLLAPEDTALRNKKPVNTKARLILPREKLLPSLYHSRSFHISSPHVPS